MHGLVFSSHWINTVSNGNLIIGILMHHLYVQCTKMVERWTRKKVVPSPLSNATLYALLQAGTGT
jgi:hypothetical protein